YSFEKNEHEILVKEYLQGKIYSNNIADELNNRKILPLPVKLFNTKSIWPNNNNKGLLKSEELIFNHKWINLPNVYSELINNKVLKPNSTWLIFSDKNNKSLLNVKEELEKRGINTVQIFASNQYRKLDDYNFEIEIDEAESYQKVFKD